MTINYSDLRFGAVTILALFLWVQPAFAQEKVHIISALNDGNSASSIVTILRQEQPVTLVLTSEEAVSWTVYPKRMQDIKRIIVNSRGDSNVSIVEPPMNDSGIDRDDIDVAVFNTEKTCYPGDARPSGDTVSFAGSFKSTKQTRRIENFLEGLELATGIKVDRANSVIKASRFAKNFYDILPNKIRAQRLWKDNK